MFPHQPLAQRIALLTRLTTLERLAAGVGNLLREYQIHYFFFGIDRSLSLVRMQLLTLHNLPTPWAQRYFADELFLRDPTVLYARAHRQPIAWRQLLALPCCTGPNTLPVLQQHQQHGLRSGYTLPLRSHGGAAAWLTLACTGDDTASQALLHAFLPQAVPLAATIQECALRLAPLLPTGQPLLNARERDCLALASEGLTNVEIGAALGVSDRTAIYHITNACRKIGARNRQQAITRALLSGQLGSPHGPVSHTDVAAPG